MIFGDFHVFRDFPCFPRAWPKAGLGGGVSGGPDPYHGWYQGSTVCPYPITPGTRTTLQMPWPAVPRVSAGLRGLRAVHQASFGYSGESKIALCLKLHFSVGQKGPCQNCTFRQKSLPNQYIKVQKCHFWRFCWKSVKMTLFLGHHWTPLVYTVLEVSGFP